jgi:hypothetical protein
MIKNKPLKICRKINFQKLIVNTLRDIIASNSSRESADRATEAALENSDYFSELIELTRFAKPPLNWRAARVLELCDTQNSNLIKPYINILAQEFFKYKISGLNRILPKLFSKHINDLNEDSQGIVADKCFKILINPKEPLAVLVNAMQFLFDLSKIYSDLKPELFAVIEQLLSEKYHSAAIKSRAQKILKNLDFENYHR